MKTTESINPRYAGLDTWSDEAILAAFAEGQERAAGAVRSAIPELSRAATAIVGRLGDRGRLIYVGAGSSGLIAALDGMELAGTFGWPESRTLFVMANGHTIAPGLPGGSEDDAERGRAEMDLHAPSAPDCVIAVTASGSTPFTLSATAAAKAAGALTVGIANNRDAPLLQRVDVPVFLDSGPEIIVGSTRMGAGTAQKAALGLLSSLVMIRLGHIYDGLMVNLRVDNQKLRQRAVATLVHITGAPADAADAALHQSNGSVKNAALILKGIAASEAGRLLAAAKGNLRTALARL
ncbi:MAG TPA: N-acetylmuramic acid 6-phosphate etherase [Bauldia sp.]|nr:N-acetylmuramic acid 6-phosphate etherase [Bauldia sp.]